MAKKAKTTTGPTPIDAIKHKDARVNIPTRELRGFVATDEAAPPRMLYPRDTAKPGDDEPELTLFSDFNGIDEFDKKVDFYSHDAGSQPHWSNRMILGDSLLVMTSLAETWIQASGSYIDADGAPHRVAVAIGPEHGTVGPQHVKNAALEAVKGLGHDVLVVCGSRSTRTCPKKQRTTAS